MLILRIDTDNHKKPCEQPCSVLEHDFGVKQDADQHPRLGSTESRPPFFGLHGIITADTAKFFSGLVYVSLPENGSVRV
jgi:hypothetical protein